MNWKVHNESIRENRVCKLGPGSQAVWTSNKFCKTDCQLYNSEQVTQYLLVSISSPKKVGCGYKQYLEGFWEN